ncbi:NUDIX hydrolase [Rothia sp. ND6WE1A]|uniref:NUDIX domain-containing protein n=1 Tax=Rothia sp. ND6WE1A TaxID=1848190 RepID=UPI00082E7E9C|nr:NUDIX hydrolase [Rothia sp. ND6WE1A]
MADTYLSHDELVKFIATLPTRRLAAGALIRDEQNRLLAVEPNYRDGWALPGGTVEAGEAPQQGCFREVQEEVGLDLALGRVLLIFHGLSRGVWGDSTYYIYDGGQIPSDAVITLQEDELLSYRWIEPAAFENHFGESFAARLKACYRALETGETVELSSHDS